MEALTGEVPIDYAIEQTISFLNANARRSHPKKDKDSLSMKPRVFEADFVDEAINI